MNYSVCVCDCEEGGVQGVKGCVGRVVDLNGTAPSVSPPRQGQQGRLSGDAKAARSLHRADQPPVPRQTWGIMKASVWPRNTDISSESWRGYIDTWTGGGKQGVQQAQTHYPPVPAFFRDHIIIQHCTINTTLSVRRAAEDGTCASSSQWAGLRKISMYVAIGNRTR